MYRTLVSIPSLLVSNAILLVGSGLLTTLPTLRTAVAGCQTLAIGIIMAMYFIGFMAGTCLCPAVIVRVGHNWRRYGRVITAAEKTAFVPITRTTHAAMDGIATDRH
jgi:hypothetical protein